MRTFKCTSSHSMSKAMPKSFPFSHSNAAANTQDIKHSLNTPSSLHAPISRSRHEAILVSCIRYLIQQSDSSSTASRHTLYTVY